MMNGLAFKQKKIQTSLVFFLDQEISCFLNTLGGERVDGVEEVMRGSE